MNRLLAIDSIGSYIYQEEWWDNMLFYQTNATWSISNLKNSLVIQLSPFSDFLSVMPDVFLVKEIYEDSIILEKIELSPRYELAISEAIDSRTTFNFDYDICKLSKSNIDNRVSDPMELNSFYSKVWHTEVVDSLLNIGRGGRLYPDRRTRIYPDELKDINYRFNIDGSYHFEVGDSSYHGYYEFTNDLSYLLLDKDEDFASCIKIVEVSDNNFIIQQKINVLRNERGFDVIYCNLTLR